MGGSVAFAQQPLNSGPCPTRILAPYGIDPSQASPTPIPGGECGTTNCLVNFKNYRWWTGFTFNPSEGYYNGGLGTIFAPQHVVVDGQGNLHLRMAKDWNGNTQWAGAEAVLMFQADGTEANLGYGDYLVAAEIVRPLNTTFATFDPNVALGMFTYERPATGSEDNSAREIDLAEISRWGWDHVTPPDCPFRGKDHNQFRGATLCDGNAQFALQDYTKHVGMVKRYDIGLTNEVTLVMKWRAGQVTFQKYNGIHTFANLPTPDSAWTTPPDLSPYVPTPNCERFHINLWLGNYFDTNWNRLPDFTAHAGPTDGQEVEVVIRNFEFQAAVAP